jgi:Domain of Unknown Function (DUF1080)
MKIYSVPILTVLLAVVAQAQMPKLSGPGWKPLIQGDGLAGWHAPENQATAWYRASGVTVKEGPKHQLLERMGEAGPLLVNGPDGRTTQLVSDDRFGDLELYLEFLIPAKSNSGIYIAGLYEVQILDSFGVEHPGVHDCGAIYERWINEKGVGGTAPLVNASKRPGEWQTFHIWFHAPRFDSAGKKIADAHFSKVEMNGVVIQRDVAAPGPTRAGLDIPEAPRNPIMLQGDHGPVAFRNMYIRALKK